MKKLLLGSIVVNAVLFGALAYIMVELSPWPEPTPPAVKFVIITNAVAVAEIPANDP
jgi:hypothetical protein